MKMTRNFRVRLPAKAKNTTSSKISNGATKLGHEKSFLDPLPVLGGIHNYSISLLAMLANHGGVVSGSQVIPGGSTSDSDFDIYQPFHPRAIEDVMHVLSFASIRWNNILSDRLDEVAKHQTAIVPYDLIWSLVEALSPQPSCPLDQLLEYLQACFKGSEWNPKTLQDFLCRFDHEVQECRKRVGQEGWYEPEESQKIWVYKGQETRICKLPQRTLNTINTLGKILLECHPVYGIKGEDYGDRVSKMAKEWFEHGDDSNHGGSDDECDMNDQVSRIQIRDVRKDWENLGLGGDHMREIIVHRIHQEFPYISRPEVDSLIGRVFETVPKLSPIPRGKGEPYGMSFRILRGTLPDGKKIQLMLLPTSTTPIRTILNFYATHVMCFLYGAFGAHLFHDTAEEKIGEKLDFENDRRHPWALKAIEKWEKRGWVFRDISSRLSLRRAEDNKVKMIEYKHIYEEALQKTGRKDSKLPSWWDSFFEERKHAFLTYEWIHCARKICSIRNTRTTRTYEGDDLLAWVHTELEGHDQVIPKKQWDQRDPAKIALDLWFGGIKINPNWNQWRSIKHKSWGSSLWHNYLWTWGTWSDERYRFP